MRPHPLRDLTEALWVKYAKPSPGILAVDLWGLAAAIRDAVAAEREACAKVADQLVLNWKAVEGPVVQYSIWACEDVAEVIRARGSLGPVIQHMEKTAEAADIPMEWLRCPAPKPDSGRGHEGGIHRARSGAIRFSLDGKEVSAEEYRAAFPDGHTRRLLESLGVWWESVPTSNPDDVDRPADHPSNWTSGPIVDLGGEG